MPNPPFTPLTLSVEEWQKLRSTDLYFIQSKQDAIYKELEAQAQEAATRKEAWVAAVAECASLRQRLEEAQKRIEQLEKTLTASHNAIPRTGSYPLGLKDDGF